MKSPVREFCTPGSVAGPAGNRRFYADCEIGWLSKDKNHVVGNFRKAKIKTTCRIICLFCDFTVKSNSKLFLNVTVSLQRVL